jgi:hypothetical protein
LQQQTDTSATGSIVTADVVESVLAPCSSSVQKKRSRAESDAEANDATACHSAQSKAIVEGAKEITKEEEIPCEVANEVRDSCVIRNIASDISTVPNYKRFMTPPCALRNAHSTRSEIAHCTDGRITSTVSVWPT